MRWRSTPRASSRARPSRRHCQSPGGPTGATDVTPAGPVRCSWARHDELREYHDEEWGVPQHDGARLFELLTLEGAQAGLSWLTVLRRRASYRHAFADFDVQRVARFSPKHVERLVSDASIIRHRGKIESTVANAVAVRALQADGQSLDSLLWSFVGGRAFQRDWASEPAFRALSTESTAMSAELKRRGFRFVGPTTCYSLMQAAGLVNDHQEGCFRYRQIRDLG
jgi:DNA-3-methyladenine glycosylase I